MPDWDPKANDLFLRALEIPAAEERARFLDDACAGNSTLRAQVDGLLSAGEQAGSFLEGPAAGPGGTVVPAPSPVGPSAGPGVAIGRYKLLEVIGEGGMGTVYLAQQAEPVRRLVAVKLVKAGMDSKAVLARFEAERQALALMDHPNIARVLDAGAAPDGRPFFVMELVKGVPVTRFCDEHRLGVRDRLALFADVCRAVQHAHQKGVIHRDLKPSNVLVAPYDGKPVVKVIDFGVAKAAGQPLTDRTLVTGLGAVVGTPEYMSPEQAELNNLDVDTRSDVYSLGVLLYELLTGTTPLTRERARGAALLEVLRLVREEEPPRPSTRVSTTAELPSIAANRGVEPRKLNGLIRGELDWIVMKALEKDRAQRYETANGLAKDIDRYLADEPVQACPPTAAYRLRKFARKHRALLRVAGLFVLLLVLAATAATWQAVRATRAEQRALAERDRAEAGFRMAREAVDELFTRVSQNPTLKGHALERFRKDLLSNARGFYERFVREQSDAPGVRYDLGLARHRLGQIHRELGDYPAAEESSRRAITTLRELAATNPDVPEYARDLAAAHAALGLVYFDTAKWDDAEAAFGQALAVQERQAAEFPRSAEYRYALAKTYGASGLGHYRAERLDLAAGRYRQAVDVLGKLLRDHPTVPEYRALMGATQLNLGQLALSRGRYDEAEAALKEAGRIYDGLVRGPPEGPPEYRQALARSRAILGQGYYGTGQVEKAEAVQQEALAAFERLAREHPDVQEYAYDVGRCHLALAETADRAGRADDALARFDKAVEIIRAAVDKGYLAARPLLSGARINRAGARAGKGDHARAVEEADAEVRRGGLNSANLYDLACVFARASAAAAKDASLSPADRTRLGARYADRAMDLLRQMVAQGWAHLPVLRKDPDLDPLRGRDDFRKLLADLEAKVKE